MPEMFVAVPPLQMPSDNSSEMENSSTSAEATARSTDSRISNSQKAGGGKKPFSKSQVKNKLRKSCGKRFQKKPQVKPFLSDKKATGALESKSRIPRALVLTPSSSSTSLSTNESCRSPLIPVVKALAEEKRLVPANSNRSCLVHQQSTIILAFHQRKSVSQMDFNHSRRQMNYAMSSDALNHYRHNGEGDKALIPSNCDENMAVTKNSFMQKICNNEYYFPTAKTNPQMAGMRIFATIMLNAWRKRRDEVRRLRDEIANLKRAAIKSKNQLHVFNTLFRSEQKRNDELCCQLKRSLDDINFAKTSCESLTTSLISLKADKAVLEQQLQIKEQEFESMNTLQTQTKTDLFKSMTVQRELQASLSMEQRKIQILENQKNELINEICELNHEAMQKEDSLRKQIDEKCAELSKLKAEYAFKEEQVRALNESLAQQLSENCAREEHTREEIAALKSKLKVTQEHLEGTLSNRLKNYWNMSMNYQKITLQIIHILTYYVLPATPPPKINASPFGFSMDKALNIVRR